MKKQIVSIIKEGWTKNLSVCSVISSIELATGLSRRLATQEFFNLAFISKP